jgi:hypothetical protein
MLARLGFGAAPTVVSSYCRPEGVVIMGCPFALTIEKGK